MNLEAISILSLVLFLGLCPPCVVAFFAHTLHGWAAKSALPGGQILEKVLRHNIEMASKDTALKLIWHVG